MLCVGGTCLGGLLFARGELTRAVEYYDQLLANALETRNPVLARLTCNSLGVGLTGAGHPQAAATIFGALESQPSRPLTEIWERQRLDAVATLRVTMTGESFDQCHSRGQAMNLEQLLQFAREEVRAVAAAVIAP